MVISGLSKITLPAHSTAERTLIEIDGTLRVEAALFVVLPLSDIASLVPLLSYKSIEFNSLKRDNWLAVHLLLPRCAIATTVTVRTNDTLAWAEVRGFSCGRAEKSTETALFIGLGCGLGFMLVLAMALRVPQWTYVIYTTSESVRRRYHDLRTQYRGFEVSALRLLTPSQL